jgi:hypothetical protein
MHPQLTLIVAQEHIADLHRAADRRRLVRTATTATSVSAAAVAKQGHNRAGAAVTRIGPIPQAPRET